MGCPSMLNKLKMTRLVHLNRDASSHAGGECAGCRAPPGPSPRMQSALAKLSQVQPRAQRQALSPASRSGSASDKGTGSLQQRHAVAVDERGAGGAQPADDALELVAAALERADKAAQACASAS